MAAGDAAGQSVDHFVPVEIARDMAHRPVGMEVPPVPACDAGRFLPAMLQGMEAKRNHGGGGFSAPHTEYAALLAQLVVVKGMCRKHRAHLSAIWRSQLVSGAHIDTVKADRKSTRLNSSH